MLRLRPDRLRQPSQRLHGRRSGRKTGIRGVDASAHRNWSIHLGYLQPARHVHGDCCGAISILCSAGQPLSQPLITGAFARFLLRSEALRASRGQVQR